MNLGDAVSGAGDDIIGAIGFFVLGLLLAALTPVILLALFTGIELLLLLAVLPFALAGRMLFGRRWWVQVRRGWRLTSEEMVGDWTASGARVRELANQIRLTPPIQPAQVPDA
ncbi:MAG: hypothetical protein QM572_10845 [Nocardioides sp.]|uniref:hypothetical protein n=1 Tax=Nocardioides sp. TaxID=35761 RepID=UPI0039E66E85